MRTSQICPGGGALYRAPGLQPNRKRPRLQYLSVQTTRCLPQRSERCHHTLHSAAERGGEINSDALSCLSAVGFRCCGNLLAPSSVPASSQSRQCPQPLNTERQGAAAAAVAAAVAAAASPETAALPVLDPISPRLLSAGVGRMSAGFYCGGGAPGECRPSLLVLETSSSSGGAGGALPQHHSHPPTLICLQLRRRSVGAAPGVTALQDQGVGEGEGAPD